MGRLFVISGPSGVGKGTVLKEFLKMCPDFKLSVSCTTRHPREGEAEGVNYFYITPQEFKDCIEKDEFLEWTEFSGNMYGTKKSYVENKLAQGENIILELDTVGALNVKKIIPQATLIFILPPSFEELESRLRGRRTETEEEIQKRLGTVKREMENSKLFDYQIKNIEPHNAANEIKSIIS